MTQIEQTIIESNITAQISGAYIAPLVLSGPPGIGKTSYFKQLAAHKQMALCNYSAASLVAENLSGLPEPVTAPDMVQFSRAQADSAMAVEWSVPEMILFANRQAESNPGGSILLLDDLHELGMATKPYLYELLLERALGQYKLHPSVAIVATMNDSDEANFSGMSSAVRNRLAILPIQFHFDSWFKEHACYFHPFVASFLQNQPNFAQEDESTEIEGFATPRSHDFLSNTLATLPDEFIVDNSALLASQYMSAQASQAFATHVNYISAIDFSSIVQNRTIVDIDALEPLDVILYSYISHYIHTIDDAVYLIDLIDANINSSVFIGFTIGNIFNVYLALSKGKPATDGMKYLVAKFTKQDPAIYNIKLTEAQAAKQFANQSQIEQLAAEFIL